MKIIKKLCIPLLSLVLVLGCFSVSQMDASAAMSANDLVDKNISTTIFPASLPGAVCTFVSGNMTTIGLKCNCRYYTDSNVVYSNDGRPAYGTTGRCRNCGHSITDHGGSPIPSHTHNYSTTWGAWRKISSCRFPG